MTEDLNPQVKVLDSLNFYVFDVLDDRIFIPSCSIFLCSIICIQIYTIFSHFIIFLSLIASDNSWIT